jgi:uncharacterized radical SAM protein YgiQ
MGERAVTELAAALAAGTPIASLTGVRGTVVTTRTCDAEPSVQLPSLADARTRDGFFTLTKTFETHYRTTPLFQPFAGRFLKHNPPAEPLTTAALDALYDLPFARAPHPRYRGARIPAFVQIKDSITSHRGCFGGCNFCALGQHQGKTIQSRSSASIVREIARLARAPRFGGTISDIGGPTANMYGARCARGISDTCRRASCVMPRICPHLQAPQAPVRTLLRASRAVPGVARVYVASGVRYDLALGDDAYIRDLALYYTGGRLKLAPEHISPHVLRLMNKPDIRSYEAFQEEFLRVCARSGAQRQIVPYLIVGHPGTTLRDAVELALYLRRRNLRLEQIQEFTPTPMTISTCMYFTGRAFPTHTPVHVPKGREIRLQKALAQWYLPDNRKYVAEALRAAGASAAAKELLRP